MAINRTEILPQLLQTLFRDFPSFVILKLLQTWIPLIYSDWRYKMQNTKCASAASKKIQRIQDANGFFTSLLTQASYALLHPVRPSELLVPFQSEVSTPCSELDLSLGASALLVDLYEFSDKWNNYYARIRHVGMQHTYTGKGFID
jgi:hypothetical protein